MKVLLIGISTRALAQSATRAGNKVISLDFFGDSDQPSGTEVHALVRDLGEPPELSALARTAVPLAAQADKVVVEAGLENEPALLAVCPAEKRWGNSAEAVRASRNLDLVQQALQGTGVCLPETVQPGKELPARGRFLLKDLAHSGGLGVREWDGSTPPRGSQVLQRLVEGELASACFVANGRQARLIGLTRQYAGVPELCAPAFAWSGNAAPWGGPELEAEVCAAIDRLTAACGLTGLNGIDFIVHGSTPYLLEVNPRPPASFELFEHLLGINAFQIHVDGCEGRLPPRLPPFPASTARAKGILYTREALQLGNTTGWAVQDVADVPHSGELIPAGAPVCTLFASGTEAGDCWQVVLARAQDWPPGRASLPCSG